MTFPKVVVNPHHCSFEPFKGGHIFVTKTEFLSNVVRERILDHFPQRTVVPANAVLVLYELDEIVNCFPIIGEGD